MIDIKPVLIVCDEKEALETTEGILHQLGLRLVSCPTVSEALSLLSRQRFSAVLCHDTLPDGDFRAVLAAAKPVPTIVLSRLAEWDPYLQALRAGAFDYIACPPSAEETQRILRAAVGPALEAAHITQTAA